MPCEYQAYSTLQAPVVIKGYLTCCDKIRKVAWANGLKKYISSNSHLNFTDFTAIRGALKIAADLNIKIDRTTITKFISNSGCGFRLSGRRGQWVIDVERFC